MVKGLKEELVSQGLLIDATAVSKVEEKG